ncbi:MAG: hypothetical protein WA945_10960 [Arcobacteraceae bacterium]
MGLLLYKSDEMYSSTELIRKSKMIFDKVLNKEIGKAIILRDGKPCFLLMDFKKYEKIMAEYEELKEYINSIKNDKKTPPSLQTKEENILEKTTSVSVPIQNISNEDKIKIQSLIEQEEMQTEKIKENETDETIKKRILLAREERAKILADEKQNQEDLKEELILQTQLKEEKLKKSRELKEFWD